MTHADRMIAEALEQGDAVKVRYWTRIRGLVDEAPPLDGAQRDQLRLLLRPEAAVIADQARRMPHRPGRLPAHGAELSEAA